MGNNDEFDRILDDADEARQTAQQRRPAQHRVEFRQRVELEFRDDPPCEIARQDELHLAGDRLLIDGAVEGSARLSSWLGASFARMQNGDGQWYAALIAFGMLAVLMMAAWLRRGAL